MTKEDFTLIDELVLPNPQGNYLRKEKVYYTIPENYSRLERFFKEYSIPYKSLETYLNEEDKKYFAKYIDKEGLAYFEDFIVDCLEMPRPVSFHFYDMYVMHGVLIIFENIKEN